MQVKHVTILFALVAILTIGVGPTYAGLITYSGPTGMFIHPIAEVHLDKIIMPQSCYLYQDLGAGNLNAVQAMASYTAPTRTEIGGVFLYANFPGDDSDHVGGAFIRQMIVEEKEMLPAVAIAGGFLEGDIIKRQNLFAMVRQPLVPEGKLFPIHLNVGAKWTFVGDDDDGTVYGGLEFEVLKDLTLIAEVASKSDFETEVPYAFGLQYFAWGKLGISLSGINTGNADSPGVFFGIGYAFTGD